MKILFISYAFHPKVGGIESSALMLSREFDRLGHAVKVITHVEKDDRDELDGLEVIRRPSMIRQWRLAREADLIYYHNPAFTYWLPSVSGRKTVFSIHTWVSRIDRSMTLKDRVKQLVLTRFPCISNSRATAEHLLGESVVIENAYDDSIFHNTTDWHARKGAAFVGRLVSDKGVSTAISAIAKLRDRRILMPFWIIGSGPEERALRDQAADLKVTDLVKFRGRLKPSAVAATLNKMKYLLVPSKWEEPFGIVALEGVACGCIPVGTNRGGLPDAIGACGPLFDNGNASQLADWLLRLESDSDLVSSFHAKQPTHLKEHSLEVVSQRHLDVFRNALAPSHG